MKKKSSSSLIGVLSPWTVLVSVLTLLACGSLPLQILWRCCNAVSDAQWQAFHDITTYANLYLVTVALYTLAAVVDEYVYGTVRHCLRTTFKQHNFSAAYVIGCMVNNLLNAPVAPLLCMYVFHRDVHAHFDLALVLRVSVAYALADLSFYFLHRCMHRHAPAMHLLHHCCLQPTFTSNLVFAPHDFLAEFGVPVGVAMALLLTPLFGQYDPFAFFVASEMMFIHYTVDHDPLWGLAHYRHHTHVSSQYYVYYPGAIRRDALESIRPLLIQHGASVAQSDAM
eukprot:gnl/Spiro4/779_TR425_c0_g1_i1.p1 gnl/Spiro4/779_TR425_c0_g1~~gnl/Spiro4/779_TR425_c0_g1_i1.p1  ORF type:complete len:282 (-),score=101.43 gnl/Spiro4/779_TR425_c0_g1_i1:103-948(-)